MKIYEYRKHKIYYSHLGRKWVVVHLSNNKTEEFSSILKVVAAFPFLLGLEPIKLAHMRALEKIEQQLKNENSKKMSPRPSVPRPSVKTKNEEQVVNCYYCDGSGISAFLKCPNCNGKGIIIVTSKGF